MHNVEKEERKNRRTGMFVSIGIHGILLLCFLFILAWRAPDPPLPEYGIELNFGLDNVGSGDVQPETPVTESEAEEEAAPEEVPEVTEETEAVESVEDPVEPTAEPVEEVVPTQQESPHVVPEIKKETPKPVVKEEKKVEEKKPVTKPVETKPPVKPADGAKGTDGDSKTPQSANHGDDTNKEGDKGDEKGTLDSRALYGTSGGGGGSSLDMSGWMWDSKPQPKDNSNESGRIVFEVKVDSEGEILSVKTIERGVSAELEAVYRAEVEKLTFSKTSSTAIVPPVSTGKITFVIRSK